MGSFLSTKFDPDTDLQDLTGKVILVTGGNTGIGYATVKHLARRGAKVYMAARNESKATGALASLEAEGLGTGKVLWHRLDLSHPLDAKKSAEEFLKREERLDVLINNAAKDGLPTPYVETEGVSSMMIVNHISPFIFTKFLLPLLKKTATLPNADVRIVNLSSGAHYLVAANTRFRNLEDFNREFPTAFVPNFARYSLSKLANALFTVELQKRLDEDGTPIIAVSVDPGPVNTFADRLPGYIRPLGQWLMSSFFLTWDQGSYNSVFSAAAPVVRERSDSFKGAYIQGTYGKIRTPSKNARDPVIAAELWKTTEDYLTTINLN